MTPQEIIENNILLAEFMGFKAREARQIVVVGGEEYMPHRDWNWLMRVVEKIEDKGGLFKSFRWTEEDLILNEGYWCTITDHFSEKLIADSAEVKDTDTKIEATYIACVEFVKWYNQNKGGK